MDKYDKKMIQPMRYVMGNITSVDNVHTVNFVDNDEKTNVDYKW